jgi:hypothetical protein
MQEHWLPLPLLEAQSYWIANDIVGYQGQIPELHEKLIKSFQVLYDEFGDDLHRLLWGELSDSMLPNGYSWRAKRFRTQEQMLEDLMNGVTTYSNLQHHVIKTSTTARELVK